MVGPEMKYSKLRARERSTAPGTMTPEVIAPCRARGSERTRTLLELNTTERAIANPLVTRILVTDSSLEIWEELKFFSSPMARELAGS
jgi:hypothetical protein